MTSATSELGHDELERLRAGLEILALRSLRDREAAQETLTRAVEASKQGRIKNPEKLGVFVRGIARHVIADMIRAREHTTGLEALAGTPSDPDEIADRLNEPAGRIRKRKSRALHRLRSAFLERTETGHESGSPPRRLENQGRFLRGPPLFHPDFDVVPRAS